MEEEDGQPNAKRPRLSPPNASKDEGMDDAEAMLALAAHSAAADPFNPE